MRNGGLVEQVTNLSYPVSDVITLTEKKGDWGNTIADLGGALQGAQ